MHQMQPASHEGKYFGEQNLSPHSMGPRASSHLDHGPSTHKRYVTWALDSLRIIDDSHMMHQCYVHV